MEVVKSVYMTSELWNEINTLIDNNKDRWSNFSTFARLALIHYVYYVKGKIEKGEEF